MTTNFVFRMFLVSGINYLFGNSVFALLWGIFKLKFQYWEIATLSTILAAIFSYQTQSRFILKNENLNSFVNSRFVGFQLLGLALSILMVPLLASSLRINIVFSNFIWSAFFSILSLVLLSKKKFDARKF